MKTVGILGGGQLGLMLANSIYTLGGQVIIYDPDPDAPACRHTNKSINGAWTDYRLIESFVKNCDVITYEFENVECEPLIPLTKISPIYPSLDVLATTQSRIKEKTFLKEAGLPHVEFSVITSIDELKEKSLHFPMPFVLKTARGGYDGKGQYLIETKEQLNQAIIELERKSKDSFYAILEEFVTVSDEVSCIVARDLNGKMSTFPVFENFHKNHILDKTLVPARFSKELTDTVEELARNATIKLDVRGLLTTEFFLSKQTKKSTKGTQCGEYTIHINEFAPRPHNSGHVTRDACHISQFDALARILLEVPVTSCKLNSQESHCMVNILGDTYLCQQGKTLNTDSVTTANLDLNSLSNNQSVKEVVLYGKRQARTGRKMGHFTTCAKTPELALQSADRFQKELVKKSQTEI